MQKIRGDRIGMVFQEPMTSLNPTLRIGEQIAEPLMLHRGMRQREAEARGDPRAEAWSAWAMPSAGCCNIRMSCQAGCASA